MTAAFAAAKPKFYPSRQRFTLPPVEGAKRGVALVSGKALDEYSLKDGSVLLFKDLGPQVGPGGRKDHDYTGNTVYDCKSCSVGIPSVASYPATYMESSQLSIAASRMNDL